MLHLDVLALQKILHHQALCLVGRHTERRLTELVQLVRVGAERGQLVHHICVPAHRFVSYIVTA